jgi:hypothetical protein
VNGWFWCMLAGGLVLAVWNAWQRRGRSAAARAWTHDWMGSFKVKSVLVLRPLLVIVLVLGGLLPLASHSTVALAICSVLILASLLGIVAYFLPLPIPQFVIPRWYRDELVSAAGHPVAGTDAEAKRSGRQPSS